LKQNTIRRLISIGILALLLIFFSLTSDYFFNAANLLSILRDASVIGIIAVGGTFVIITAGIDLSTGALLAFVGMTMANCYKYTSMPIWTFLLIGLAVGAAGGYFNGVIITRLKLPEFIATLSTQGIFRALAFMTAITVNGVIKNQVINDPDFTAYAGDIGGFYYVSIAFILIAIIGQIVLKKTRFGTYVYSTGANIKTAELAGINTGAIRRKVYLMAGVCCAIGAIFMCSRMNTATADFGVGMEFDVIAAIVIGGCALDGGRGDVLGSVIGALFMAVLDSGIYKYQINTSLQPIIKGSIIILFVVFDACYIKKMKAKTGKKQEELTGEVSA
jgi:ribose transport system permease protein